MHLEKVRKRFEESLGRSIFINKIILYNISNQKVELACKKCDKTKIIWTPQIYTGNWSVCEHDLD